MTAGNDKIESLKGELYDLLKEFNKGVSLSRPVELLEMAEKVANQIEKRKEEDIDNWAEGLSKEMTADNKRRINEFLERIGGEIPGEGD